MNDRVGDWMQTYLNKQFWPLDPRPEEIDILDIAHALSMTCRFGGHCRTFYSVAEHSLHVSRVCDPEDALWGLLHDASEAYIADIIRPIKCNLKGYKEIEDVLMACVSTRFGLTLAMPKSVKLADARLLATEAAQLFGKPPVAWQDPAPIVPGLEVGKFGPDVAEYAFLARFFELTTIPD